jgi:acyl-CoA dehydrogenase
MGLADAAVELAKTTAAKRPGDLAVILGEMLNSHTTATLAMEDMIRKNDNLEFKPDNENSNDILTRKTLVTTATQRTVELAAEIVGGAGFFKGHPMERICRDIKAAHFHPLPYRRQYAFSGRIALGLDPVQG